MDPGWSGNGQPVASPPAAPLSLPDGAYPARLDDRGRLRLPAVFVRYFDRLAERELFVTSVDNVTVQIYPIAVWRQRREALARDTANPDAADVLFVANHNGANAQVDAQGRILIHEELRRRLGLEGRPLMIVPWVWRVTVMTEEVYQARLTTAQEGLSVKVQRVQARGLL